MLSFFNNKISPCPENVESHHNEYVPTLPSHSRQIIEMPGNSRGNDYFATNPHGHYDVLEAAVKKLGKHDRLFLCGDVIDRGPFSLQNIRYIAAQNQGRAAGQEKIITIRGNHEDLALMTIHFLEVIDSIQKRNNNLEKWAQFKCTAPNTWLQPLSEDELDKMSTQFTCVVNFVHANTWSHANQFKSQAMNFKDSCIANFCGQNQVDFFFNAWLHIYNGGGWLFKLDKHERDEVKAFIEPLPYMIRIDEARKHSNIIPRVDIVHAAPLGEAAIHDILSGTRFLSLDEIMYMTEARFKEDSFSQTNRINHQGRDRSSILTLVGHSPFGMTMHPSNYLNINLLNLDIATYRTCGMLLINYTAGSVEYLSHPKNLYSLLILSTPLQIKNVIKIIQQALQDNRSLLANSVEENTLHSCCAPLKWF